MTAASSAPAGPNATGVTGAREESTPARRLGRWLRDRTEGPTARLLLSMVLAVAVGFLLEVALIDGLVLDRNWRNFLLLALGLAAGMGLVLLWFRDLSSAAKAGVFFHVALEDRSERPMAEDALLRWWVGDTWEHATVMPLVGEVRQAPRQADRKAKESTGTAAKSPFDWDDIEAASTRLSGQIAHSRVLAPGARSVSVLVHGRPELIAPLGGLVAGQWRDDRALRLVVDNTSPDRAPFFVFDAPIVESAVGMPPSAKAECADAAWASLLVLKRAGVKGTRPATQAPEFSGPIPDAEQQTDAGSEWHVRFTYPLAEEPDVYETVARVQADALAAITVHSLPGAGASTARVGIQGQAPVSLAFAAGFLAGRSGFTVGLMRYLGGSDGTRLTEGQALYSLPTWPASAEMSPPATAPTTQPDPTLSRNRWTWLVLLRALGLGAVLPFFAGAFALLLEWGVARSQPVLNAGDWLWLVGILLVTAVALLAGGAVVRRRLTAPGITITLADDDAATDSKQTFAHRRLVVDSSQHDTAMDLAVRITAAFTDALTVLPQVLDVTIDLGGHPLASDAIHNFNFGLRSSLRGNAPASLRWSDVDGSGQRNHACASGPGDCAH